MQLPLNVEYEMDYRIYILCNKKIWNKAHIEQNYNDEDFYLWMMVDHYNDKVEKANG
jgi:hypothetical protein